MILITTFDSLKMRNTFFTMKSRMFLLVVIGMITLTSMASTPLMEQKQKATTFVVQNYQDVVTVQPIDLSSIQFEATITISYNAKPLQTKSFEPEHSFAIIDDVGWNSQKRFSQSNIYQQRLKANYLIDHKLQISKLGLKYIRQLS